MIQGKDCFRSAWSQTPVYSGGNIANVVFHPQALTTVVRGTDRKGRPTQTVHPAFTAPPELTARRVGKKGSSKSSKKSVEEQEAEQDENEEEEAIISACGDTLHVVSAKSGVTLASYALPIEDVILHVDGVALSSKSSRPVPKKLDAANGKPASEGKKKKKKAAKQEGGETDAAESNGTAAETTTTTEMDPGLEVPPGAYIAFSTRALQVYVLELVRVAERTQKASSVLENGLEELPEEAASTQGEGRKRRREEKEWDESESSNTKGDKQDEYSIHYELRLLRNWTAAQQAVSMVAFSSGGQYLLSGSTDGGLKGWNVFHHHLTHNLRIPSGGVITALALDASEQRLAVGNYEGWVAVFDFESKTLIGHARHHTSAVEAISFLPADESNPTGGVVSVSRDRKISIFTASKHLEERRAVVVKEHVSCALFESPFLLHVGSLDGIVATYKISATEPLTLVRRLPKPASSNIEDSDEELAIRSLALAGKPKPLAAAGTADRDPAAPSQLYVANAAFVIALVGPHPTAAVQYSTRNALVGYLDQILQVALLPPGPSARGKASSIGTSSASELLACRRVVVTNSKDVRVFNTRGCLSDVTLRGHTDIVLCCATTSDGSLVATAGKDKTVRVWCTRTWQEVATGVDGHDGDVTGITFNCKQTASFLMLVSVGADDHVRMWDIGRSNAGASYGWTSSSSSNSGSKNAATPDAEQLAFKHKAAIDGAHDGAVYSVAFAPNDTLVATGGKNRVVNLWNVTGKKLYREGALKGHRRGISSLAFSSTDRVLASASNDGTVKLWSLASLTCVKSLQADKVPVLQIAMFNGGTQLVTGNAEGVLRVWAIAASEPVWSGEVHEEKVWSLVVAENETQTLILSGAADGVLVATEDYTAEEAERLRVERHDEILKEQALANAMRQGQFAAAFQHALNLSHPRHLRQIIARWATTNLADCESTIRDVLLPSMSADDLHRLLEFTRQWVANARHCTIASLVTSCFLGAFHYTALAKMSATHQVLEALISYLNRHSNRLHDGLRSMYYVDYVTQRYTPVTLTTRPPYALESKQATSDSSETVPTQAN